MEDATRKFAALDSRTEMKEILIEGAQDEDIRAAFDMFKEISAKKDTVKLDADILLILTAIDKVYLNYTFPNF